MVGVGAKGLNLEADRGERRASCERLVFVVCIRRITTLPPPCTHLPRSYSCVQLIVGPAVRRLRCPMPSRVDTSGRVVDVCSSFIGAEVIYSTFLRLGRPPPTSFLPQALTDAYLALAICPGLALSQSRGGAPSGPAPLAAHLRHRLGKSLALWVGTPWLPAFVPRLLAPGSPRVSIAALELLGDLLPPPWALIGQKTPR